MRTYVPGYFITFEGGDGVGKTTQIFLLAHYLRKKGCDVVTTREPGGTVGAEVMRHILLSGKIEQYGSFVEAFCLTAARLDHVSQVIAPSLYAGKVVLCDRFIDSTRVYQGLNNKLNSHILALLERIAIDNIVPDLTFLLDIPAKLAIERMNLRRKQTEMIDYFEKDAVHVQEARRQAFLQLAQKESHRFHVIDATCEIKVITQKIKAICCRVMSDYIAHE